MRRRYGQPGRATWTPVPPDVDLILTLGGPLTLGAARSAEGTAQAFYKRLS